MAFWNNFLPLLHESGKTESNPEHHLLPQHYLKSSYFGVVKQKNGHTKIPFIPPPLPPTPIPQELTTLLQQRKMSEMNASKKESQINAERDKQRRSKKLNVSGAVMDEQGGYDMGTVNTFSLANPANIVPQRMPLTQAPLAAMNPTLEPMVSLQDGDIHPLLRSIHQPHQLHSGSVITEHEPLLNQKVISPVCPRHSKHATSNTLEEIQV
ncbi:unnamed protein product [Soboliphyme baturini]|uniref:Ovule protein n=1 Tax=Soboliphyme baturini TaxID=241478 RepID=A0A183IDY5_9BILA|nr:unnamed protein product [Soboliphyme baturini]